MLFLSGKMGPAKKHVTRALRLDPSCEPAMKLRKRVMDVERLEEEGNAAFRSRQLLEALEKYSRALEVNQTSLNQVIIDKIFTLIAYW